MQPLPKLLPPPLPAKPEVDAEGLVEEVAPASLGWPSFPNMGGGALCPMSTRR